MERRMESNGVFDLSEEDEEKLLRLRFRKYTPEEMKEIVKELMEWKSSQPHLPKKYKFDPPEDVMERAFMHGFQNKELTKRRLDLHFTYVGKNKDFYEIVGTEKCTIPSRNPIRLVILPKLHEKGERVGLAYLENVGTEEYEFDHVIQTCIPWLEILFKLDRAQGCIVIIDCKNFDMHWAKKTDIATFLRLATHLHEGYMTRVSGVHLLNPGAPMQFFINLCKTFASGQLLSKMYVHDSLKSLHEIVEPKYLPAEYGGTCGNVEDIIEKMDQVFLQNRDYVAGIATFATDESKRVRTDNNGSTFGVDIFF